MVELELWEKADNYAGETYYDYYVVYGKNRDSDALTLSNFDAITEELKGFDGFISVVSTHWLVGWIETIMIHKDDELGVEKAIDLCKRLEDYPVLDEEDFSDREYENSLETLNNCLNWAAVKDGTDIGASWLYGELDDTEIDDLRSGGCITDERFREILSERGYLDENY